MGDTPKQTKSDVWHKARARSSLSLEMRTRYQRIEAVLAWRDQVPEVLNPGVSIHAAAQRVIESRLNEGKSLRSIMTAIKNAREFQAASPTAWLEHEHIGRVDTLRRLKAELAGYDPEIDDLSETKRLGLVVSLLEQVVKAVRKDG